MNVYLPERLAQAVREEAIPLSEACQRALEAEVARRSPVLEMTPRARRALSSAREEARRLGHDYVGTEHLLLALAADPAGIAGSVLRELGVTAQARDRVMEILSAPSYSEGSNKVVDSEGNLLGYFVYDDEDPETIRLVDRDGRPVDPERHGARPEPPIGPDPDRG